MIENQRMKKSMKNVSIAFSSHIVYIVLSFVVRTIFIKQMGNDYLSLQGLFTNIVLLLSFAELGIGTAIIYNLYKPLVDKNHEEIASLLMFYKSSYRYIRIAIVLISALVMFFLRFFIKGIDEGINYYPLYILFVFNTYFSYVFSYKKTLLIADEKNYIVILIDKGFFLFQSICQCVVLIAYKNYYAFLLIQIFFTLLTNIISSNYVDRKYLYLKQYKSSKLSAEKVKQLLGNVKSILFYKIGAVLLNSTDNLLISSLIKTTVVGVYSNYSMIINAVNGILMQACNSMAATIGQYNISNDGEKSEKIFNELFFITYWIFGICSICLAVILNPFIQLWLGNDYLLDSVIVHVVTIVFYVSGINQIPSLFRTSYGIFKKAWFVPIEATLINIILSIILGKIFGLVGIFIATVIAKEFTFNIVDPYLIYKFGFKMKPYKFYIKRIIYFGILIVNYFICNTLYNAVNTEGFLLFMLKAICIFIISNLFLCVVYYRDKNFKSLMKRIIKRKG